MKKNFPLPFLSRFFLLLLCTLYRQKIVLFQHLFLTKIRCAERGGALAEGAKGGVFPRQLEGGSFLDVAPGKARNSGSSSVRRLSVSGQIGVGQSLVK